MSYAAAIDERLFSELRQPRRAAERHAAAERRRADDADAADAELAERLS